jgi:hypothetical protein
LTANEYYCTIISIHVLRRTLMESVLNKAVLSSALNAFVITLIGKFVESGADVSALTGDVLGNVLNAAVTAAAWVIIRAVNPKDTKFGIGAVAPKAAKKK